MNTSHISDKKSFAEVITPFLFAFQRYWRLTLGPAFVLVLLACFVAVEQADYYLADSIIFIQPQRITSKIVGNPSKEEMQARLEALVQEILSRPRLRGIIDQYSLYPGISGRGAAEKAIRRLREGINIIPVESQTGVRTNQTFRLEYTHTDPKLAFEVAREITNLFVEESVVSRRSEVKGTEEFLDAQLREARSKLESMEAQVQAFVAENFGKLPEHLDAAVARLQNLQQQITTNSQLLSANSSRRSFLQQEISDLRSSGALSTTVPGSSNVSGDPKEQLAQLESALVVLRSQYSERHPDVVRTKARIDALKERISSGSARTSRTRTRSNSLAITLRRELNELDVQIKTLEEENARLKQATEQLQNDIEKMPLKEQELLKINRDYANVRANYERLLAAREDASLQASLISSQRGAQFRVVQPAELPALPAGPNRPLIILIGVGVGLAVFVLGTIVLFALNSSFKFRDEVEEELGITVIGIIPSMNTRQANKLKVRKVAASIGVSAFLLIGGSVVIAFAV